MESQEAIWDRLYRERLSWKKEAINLPNLLKGKSVLEIGVGTGKTLISILRQNPKSVTAIDISQEAINKCRINLQDKRVELIKSDIITFNPKKKFDVIVCYYILNNLQEEERKAAVENMQTLLNGKGIILFEDFSRGDFREKQKRKDELICHFFTEEEIKELFKSFPKIKAETKTLHPIKLKPELQRKIISAIITR